MRDFISKHAKRRPRISILDSRSVAAPKGRMLLGCFSLDRLLASLGIAGLPDCRTSCSRNLSASLIDGWLALKPRLVLSTRNALACIQQACNSACSLFGGLATRSPFLRLIVAGGVVLGDKVRQAALTIHQRGTFRHWKFQPQSCEATHFTLAVLVLSPGPVPKMSSKTSAGPGHSNSKGRMGGKILPYLSNRLSFQRGRGFQVAAGYR